MDSCNKDTNGSSYGKKNSKVSPLDAEKKRSLNIKRATFFCR